MATLPPKRTPCQDLGRHDASNMSLLRMVFEVHLQLFGKTPRGAKTVLLFLIRDHIASQTPLDLLEKQARPCSAPPRHNSPRDPV